MGVQRAINGQLITWEVIVYGFLGMEQVAARYKDPWKAAVFGCEHNCADVKLAISEPVEPLPTNDYPLRPRHRLDAAANCTRPTLKSCLHSINYRVSWKENRTRRQDNGTAI